MKITSRVVWCAVLAASCGIVSAGVASESLGPDVKPGITPEQIEADWLRQDELRLKPATLGGANATPEQDAAGGCDGVIDGKWGFHTQNEANPWWQVDLGHSTALDRLVIYNRCDGCAERNGSILVLLSDDAKDFRQAYQHDGTVFYGQTDKKPLVVPLSGTMGRYVRLRLPATSYLHLDEVEVYASGDTATNIALGMPAAQSSTSQWSARHDAAGADGVRSYPLAQAIGQGLRLAENLRRLGAGVDAEEQTLRELGERLKADLANAAPDEQRAAYFHARWAVRRMALRNPLVDFDTILFVKRAPGMFPHVSDQHYGWWSRPGGGVFLLSGIKGENSQVRCLTEGFAPGSFEGHDLCFDGRKVVFAYCKHYARVSAVADKTKKEDLPEDSFYHIYEMNLDGSGLRQLTRGYYDDFDPRYLPDGQIAFLSTRKGTALQAGRASAAATCQATLPDSYVRCGGNSHRPVAVFTLHAMEADGGNVRAISAFENFEWTPAVAADGRILYARWDYIDRFNGHFMSLWSTNPDGTNPQLVYGNYTARPQCVFEARSVPNSAKLIFTATAHHSFTGGSLVLLDRTRGTEYDRPLTRLTPEVCFPETEGWPEHYYVSPWPLSEEHYLVAWGDRPLSGHMLFSLDDSRNPPNATGIYLYDAFGNLTLLHRDPAISSMCPIPVRPRPRPPAMPCTVAWDGPQEGRYLVQDVYRGLDGVPRGTIRRLRIVAVPPKVQPDMNQPVLGVSAEDPGKFVLGTVPVEADGSAYFRVPSGVSVFFQALDDCGRAVQTMRSLTYVQPNQTLSCIGCHEHRDLSPTASRMPLAAARDPSKLSPGPEGSWPLRYDQLVQPVLDARCADCHRPGSDDAAAARLDLTAARSYDSLLGFADKDLHKLVFERDRSIPGQCPASQSRLLALLTTPEGHYGVQLTLEDLERLVTWMDTYAQRLGSFGEAQEEELRQLRHALAPMLDP